MKKWVVITGAAGGIGKVVAKMFTNTGYEVIATDCVSRPKDLICNHYLKVDLSRTVNDENYAKDVFKQVKCCLQGDGLTALINNAAVQILGDTVTLNVESWKKTLDINLLAPFVWVQSLLTDLENRNGSVVNISSIHNRLTKKNFLAYATSKAALSGMTRAMAIDLGARIRVNAIEPAAIETAMLISGFENKENLQKLKKCHPSVSIGKPEDVAKMALFLVQSDMIFLNGSCLTLDGGISNVLHDPE